MDEDDMDEDDMEDDDLEADYGRWALELICAIIAAIELSTGSRLSSDCFLIGWKIADAGEF